MTVGDLTHDPRNAPREGPPVGATMAQHEGAAVFTSAMFTALTTVAVSSPPEKHREYDAGGSTTMNGHPTPSHR